MRKIGSEFLLEQNGGLQYVLPLHEQGLADARNSEKLALLRLLMTNPTGRVSALQDSVPSILKGAITARLSRAEEPDISEMVWNEFIVSPELGLGEVLKQKPQGGLEDFLRQDHAQRISGRILDKFGDDSVREQGSTTVLVQDHSAVLMIKTFLHSLVTGIGASTRYIDWREKVDGNWRFGYPKKVMLSKHGELFSGTVDNLFSAFVYSWEPVWKYVLETSPKPDGVGEIEYRIAVKGKVCDILRKLLPLGIKNNFGLHANYRTYSEIIMNHRAGSDEEKEFADELAVELLKVNPRFVSVVDSEHGKKWVDYQKNLKTLLEGFAGTKSEGRVQTHEPGVQVEILNKNYARDLMVALLAQGGKTSKEDLERVASEKLDDEEGLKTFFGEMGDIRTNRRHKVSSGFEDVVMRVYFEGYSLSAYKDISRHRNVLSISEPNWSGEMGLYIPPEIRQIGGKVEAMFVGAQERAAHAVQIVGKDFPEESKLLVTHGMKTRWVMTMGAGEGAFWIPELRSIATGDPEYRGAAQKMELAILEAMPLLENMKSFVDFNDYMVGRMQEAARADLQGK